MRVIADEGKLPIKAWVDGVPLEEAAEKQLRNMASMNGIVWPHVAVMPDVHWGMGSTVGSVIPTSHAIIPAAVGVDIGCGMMAARLDLKAEHLPDNLLAARSAVESAIPHGRTDNGGANDRGAWGDPPKAVSDAWAAMLPGYEEVVSGHKTLRDRGGDRMVKQLGSLGTGNHFVELCLDEAGDVWIMLHSGSRGVGNRIGSHFIALAKKEMERWVINLPDKDLAYLPEGSEHFESYVKAVSWAQGYARTNRELMMAAAVEALGTAFGRPLSITSEAVNCHHNYIAKEHHFGRDLWITRKGAVRAREGDLGIIPGSMGAKSFIVRGKGNAQSFSSCSHGAGRSMSRTEARKRFTLDDHAKATAGVECRKDAEVIDETPAAYKDIDAVMAAQADLVDIVHTLKQVLCVKG
jgi:tRNA-splicing ligase RtcB